MRKILFEVLAVALIGGSCVFFYECAGYLSKKDYVAAIILMSIGFAVIHVGKELARLALAQKE